jgi:hypothetical protein
MIVTAKRIGWNDPDYDPEERGDPDLSGELEERDFPARENHKAFTLCLVGGQEADPKTVYERQIKLVANWDESQHPRGPDGKFMMGTSFEPPPAPEFVSTKSANVQENKDAVKKMQELAKEGDLDALKAHPATLSPKVQTYKTQLTESLKEHLAANPPSTQQIAEAHGLTLFPKMENLTFVKTLPGSTSPSLMKDEATGKLWVIKTSAGNPDHLRNEADTDAAYRALGVPVAKSGIIETGSGPVKISEYIEGGQTLKEWEAGKSASERSEMNAKISQHLAADAVLANWDVVGLTKDNILIKDGTPYRIDNGGGLKYRAQGAPKGTKFGDQVSEFSSLKSKDVNPSAASVFKGTTDKQVAEQVATMMPKKAAVLAAVKDPEAKAILAKRFDYAKQWTGVKEGPEAPTPSKPEVTPPPKTAAPAVTGVHDLHSGQGLANWLSAKHTGQGLTPAYWQKIAHLNPNGLSSKEVIIPKPSSSGSKEGSYAWAKAKLDEMVSEVKDKAVPGTVIKSTGFKSTKAVGLTKKYGEEEYTTEKVEGPHKVAGIPSHLEKYLPEVQDGGSVTLPKGPMYDGEAHKAWVSSLKYEEASAVSAWKGSAAKIRKEVTEGTMGGHAKGFMAALEKAKPHTGVVYRGISGQYADAIGKQIEDAGIGGTWSDPAPHCMSLNSSTGLSFSHGQTMFRIVTKTGRPIHKQDGFNNEAEVTGMPKTVYEIAGVHKDVTVTTSMGGHSKKVKYLITLVEK